MSMAQFNEEESRVARHYDEAAFEAEQVRLPQDCPVELGVTRRWLTRVAKAGDVVAEIGVGGGHYTEFLALFEGQFAKVAFLGVESFTAAWQEIFGDLPAAEKEIWLNLVEETGQTPEGIGQSDHFLFVGRKL